jgi:hypothetical protein
MAVPQRGRRVEPPDLAVTCLDLGHKVSDLHNRLGHALHLFREPVPLA